MTVIDMATIKCRYVPLLLTLALGAGLPLIESADAAKSTLLDPIIGEFEEHMLTYGQKHADALNGLTDDPALAATYYDAIRVFYLISDYTKDSRWVAAAHKAVEIYRDNYVLRNKGSVPGYWNFTMGLRLDYERTANP